MIATLAVFGELLHELCNWAADFWCVVEDDLVPNKKDNLEKSDRIIESFQNKYSSYGQEDDKQNERFWLPTFWP